MRSVWCAALAFILGTSAWAAEAPAVPYSDRPTINSVVTHPDDLSTKQRNLFTAVHHFLVEIKALYPNRTFFILARDGEAIFDLWTLMFPHDVAIGKVRLVNVSRHLAGHDEEGLAQDPNLAQYLAQEGITKKSLQEVKPILIDSGYDGSIVEAINLLFGYSMESRKIPAHLMSSANDFIPSSRVSSAVYLKAARKKKPQDDIESEAGEILVEALEGVSHFTLTAKTLQYMDGVWQPMSAPASAEQKASALRQMARLGTYFHDYVNLEEDQHLIDGIQNLLRKLNSDEFLTADQVVELAADLEKYNYKGFWADLRESTAKLNVPIHPLRWQELWEILPLPPLDDIADNGGLALVLAQEEEFKSHVAPPRPKVVAKSDLAENKVPEFSVLDTIRHYLNSKNPQEEKARNIRLATFKKEFKTAGGLVVHRRFQEKGEKLGEGIRSDVYELGEQYVIKVAYEGEDTAALEVEKKIYDFLLANSKKYPVSMLEIIDFGEGGTYIVKPKIRKKDLANKILKSGVPLSAAQLKSLEKIYETSRKLAQETGLALDIKPDNLVWNGNEFQLVDMGPRTFFQPYFFSLEMDSFEHFMESWVLEREDRQGGFMDAADFIKQQKWNCEDALLDDYRVMKADRN